MYTLSFAVLVILGLGFFLVFWKRSEPHNEGGDPEYVSCEDIKFLPEQSQPKTESLSCLGIQGIAYVKQIELPFRVPGKIAKLYRKEGDVVSKGALLGKLDKAFLEEQIEERRAKLEALEKGADQDALADFYAAEAALNIAVNQMNYIELRAPSAGIVLSRLAEPGDFVRASDPIFILAASRSNWISAACDESQVKEIKVGQKGSISIEGGKVYSGKIGFISDEAIKGKYLLRMDVDKPDAQLKQGMPVTIQISSTSQSYTRSV